jgi:basic amino acid/polyamine antiporter, APA family
MLLDRVKSLDAILATAEKKSLNRTLGAFQLTMLGIGAVIGTGIFVLTAEAAQKAGPGMMISFIIAGFVCAFAALCYAEMASMVPVSGSAYTYSYATMGELLAWMVGWALVLEYAVAASAVAVGWSGYIVGLLDRQLGITIPEYLAAGPNLMGKPGDPDGIMNLPAAFIVGLVVLLLIKGTKESAFFNAILVAVKIAALTLFIALAIPAYNAENFEPFMPTGFVGVSAAAASIFFAYVGFDAVSTAAEETKNPNRNIPIGLLGSLAICTVFYLLVAAGAIGAVGAQPGGALSNSKEPLAYVLVAIGQPGVGNVVALAAGFALPSVVLMMMYGQTRIFFTMARDGLLPKRLAELHPKYGTPHTVTMITGVFVAIFAALFPVGILADFSNTGTLFAFMMVSISVLILRVQQPNRARSFKTPAVWVVGPLAILGTLYLFISLRAPEGAALQVPPQIFFVAWTAIGLLVYFLYSRSRSNIALGIED